MLQSELKKLQTYVDLLQTDEKNNDGAEKDILHFRQQIGNECLRVREVLTKVIFTQDKENLVERFIQFHQTGIIQLADLLQAGLTGGKNSDIQLTTGFFITQLFDLLNYIERYFSKYFNSEAKIPDSYRLIALKQLGIQISQVSTLAESKLRAALKECILNYLVTFSDEKKPVEINFRDLIYLKTFLTELEETFALKEIADWNHKISLTLLYLNFNHLGFFNYCQDVIRLELENCNSKEQCLEVLTRSLTHIKSLQTKPAFVYHSSWPNIKTMLESWLNDEIAMMVIHRDKGPLIATAEKDSAVEKMVMNLSVAQIACFIRLFFEEGCYAPFSVTEIFKFTVRHYRSKRQEHISTRSLSKEYYGINQVTAAIVRDLLQKMISRINRNYFPVWAAVYAAVCAFS